MCMLFDDELTIKQTKNVKHKISAKVIVNKSLTLLDDTLTIFRNDEKDRGRYCIVWLHDSQKKN